jgi:NAD(P)-dependent dehydrogenase (short-subunit alcohol dehydrogenase family)
MLKVLPLMKARRSGVIINVASRAGTIDYPGSTSYAVSKSALIRLTGCAQVELNIEGYGDDIQVYCLHPGGVLTDMPKSIFPPPPHTDFSRHPGRRGRQVPRAGQDEECVVAQVYHQPVSLRRYVRVPRKRQGKSSQRPIF